jgi:hypothetical protein
MIKVHSLNDGGHIDGAHYCGRNTSLHRCKGGKPSNLGNPFRADQYGLQVCLDKYIEYLRTEYQKKNLIWSELNGLVDEYVSGKVVVLECFCYSGEPGVKWRCHCDVIAHVVTQIAKAR